MPFDPRMLSVSQRCQLCRVDAISMSLAGDDVVEEVGLAVDLEVASATKFLTNQFLATGLHPQPTTCTPHPKPYTLYISPKSCTLNPMRLTVAAEMCIGARRYACRLRFRISGLGFSV